MKSSFVFFFNFNFIYDLRTLRTLRPYVMRVSYVCCGLWTSSREELCTTEHSNGNVSFYQYKICFSYNYNLTLLNVMDVTTVANQSTA